MDVECAVFWCVTSGYWFCSRKDNRDCDTDVGVTEKRRGRDKARWACRQSVVEGTTALYLFYVMASTPITHACIHMCRYRYVVHIYTSLTLQSISTSTLIFAQAQNDTTTGFPKPVCSPNKLFSNIAPNLSGKIALCNGFWMAPCDRRCYLVTAELTES
jgi:hypothetical protein